MGEENVTVVREITAKRRPLEDFKAAQPNPAKALIDALDKEELKKMMDQPQPQSMEPDEGSIALATPEESKVVVTDLSERYDVPPGFIIMFKDRRTGAIRPYFTREFYGLQIERKGYSRLEVEKTGPKHDPEHNKFHYIAELTPIIPKETLEALRLLKDVDREEFIKEYKRLTKPIVEDGFASADTVRMKTMKTPYNLDRLARTRAYRHVARLYCGVGGSFSREEEEQAEEIEGAEVIDANHEDVTPKPSS